VANHRQSWAIEETAPASGTYVDDTNRETARASRTSVSRSAPSRPPRRTVPKTQPVQPVQPRAPAQPSEQDDYIEKAILIVVSRMKDYIRFKSDFNTSERAAGPLSAIVRKACDEAIEAAGRDERTTVLERDIPAPS
jgi:hypothetical protein